MKNASSVFLITKGEIHKNFANFANRLTKRQIQCFNNVGRHCFEFATPYRADFHE
jgi:hypothetical protein